MGLKLNPVKAIASPVNGVIDSILHGTGSTTINQVPLETPEQKAAREFLAKFMQTGQFGNFTAGADIGIKGPNTAMTGTELQGQGLLSGLLNSGSPEGYSMANTALKSLLTVDPNQIAAQFDPFKAQIQRQIGESNNALKRTAGYAGNLYSTNTIQNLGDIQARGNETLTSQLASLTNAALDRAASLVPQAINLGTSQENATQGRIASAYNYGALPRTLENTGIDAANQELLRRRSESLLPLQTATQLSGQNANFGLPSVTTQNPNPMLDLLTAIISGGSKVIAAKA